MCVETCALNHREYEVMDIYCIRNKINGKVYVCKWCGADARTRWQKHCTKLTRQTHDNMHLQRAWNKYGKYSWEFDILETTNDKIKLSELEQKWIAILSATDRDRGYNMTDGGDGTPGYRHTEYSKQLMRDARLGKTYVMPDYQKSAISEGLRGKKKSPSSCELNSLTRRTFTNNKLISPLGTIVSVEPSISEFCRVNKLSSTNVSLVLRGLPRHHHGWTKFV